MGDEIIKVLNELCSKFGIAIDWTNGNVVPYLQDLMTRYAKYICYTSIMWLAVGVMITIVFGVILYKYFKSCEEDCFDGLIAFTIGCFVALGVIVMIVQTHDIIEVCTIPEKAIVEDIRYMLDNKND